MTPVKPNNKASTRASLELLYHVSREIATAIDLTTLLERILFLSMQNIGAINGSIIALADTGHPVASTLIIGSEILGYSNDQLKDTLDRGLAGWVVKNRQAVLIPDTSKDERWMRRPDDAEDATGPKSVVSTPFLAQERLAGVITLVHPQPNFFTTDHLTLIQAIADQSAVAVLNTRLHEESLRQARIMTALAQSATVITGSLNLDDVLQSILEQISHALGTEAVSLAMTDPQEEYLEYVASTSKKEHNVVGKKLVLGQGIAGWVAREKQGLIVPDAYKDDRFFPDFDKKTGFRTKAIACAPIFSQGEFIGILEAINPQAGKFDPDALTLLTGIGGLAGTAIRHAQLFEALQSTHKRYQQLFEGSINSILITDWSGEILEANQQTTIFSQFTKDDLQGSKIQMIHQVNNDILGQDFNQVAEDEAISYESVLYTKHGTQVPITVLVQSVTIDGKSYLQWVLRDDTERKELDQLREDFLSMIYHDLRSPLANIVSSLDVINSLVEFDDENPAVLSLFDIAVRSTKRIQRLVNSLLDINRLEAGKPVWDKTPTAPQSLLEESIDELKPIIDNKKLKVSIQVTADIPRVMINGEMIRRVIINLIENSIKYTPSGGRIDVGAQPAGDSVHVWVQDTGPGIPEEKRASIFDKYTRLHGSNGPKGYGLGLAYCQLAVEGHGGRIWVENIPQGGSQFSFTMPIASQEISAI
jgi:PAS domain S-box-containing protein